MRRFIAMIAAMLLTLLLTTSVALATHPGQARNGDQPQGPNQVVCDKPGKVGVSRAIGAGGSVHLLVKDAAGQEVPC